MIVEFFYHQENIDHLTKKQHSHNNQIEILFIVKGNGNIIIGDKSYFFEEGSMFIFDGTIPHYILPDKNSEYKRNKLVLNKSKLSLLINKNEYECMHFNNDKNMYKKIDDIFKKISDCLDNVEFVFKKISLVFDLIHICFSYNENSIPNSKGLIYDIMNYVNDNIRYCITIDEVAKYCHISKYHMCRKFKEQTGTTIYNYITTQRIYLAKKLLEETSKTISDIAMECGFSNISHFTNTFKKETNLKPTQYRLTYCKLTHLN